MLNARAIAFYLPQFHPVAENDLWWGKGFTEWTNTAKAKPLFPGHYQPHVPADLGFYDLRLPESRQAQADLATRYGIEGFCYYHYWFGGRRILNRPFDEVVASGEPSLPFCLCWANESWSGVWHGEPKRVLLEQNYPGEVDHRAHFETLLPAFRDPRYIRVDGKPMFIIYRPLQLPNLAATLALWRQMAEEAGLSGLDLVGNTMIPDDDLTQHGYDATLHTPGFAQRPWVSWRKPAAWMRQKIRHWQGRPTVEPFAAFADKHRPRRQPNPSYPCVVHAWDNTPRSGRRGVVMQGATPEIFAGLLSAAIEAVSVHHLDQRIVFLKSWNEWAEGNHLEPDLRNGHVWLETIKKALD